MKLKVFLNFPILISLVLFLIPFFWLKPGEMDLGGDSSRLFFYDPLSYINTQILYNIVSSGIGGEAVSYYSLPFMFLLTIMRTIFSPTIVICIINGVKLSGSFIFMYFILKEILWGEKLKISVHFMYAASIIGGVFYALSPILVNSGWEQSILSHMQIFFNPLFFYLLLKYFITSNKKFILIFLILSFIFSLGFSYAAAPPFFAFYPISLFFLLLYTKFIRKKKIPLKGLCITLLLFILLQSFHLMPHLLGIFSFETGISASIFSDQAKFSRGLDYFTAISPSIKVVISFFALPQRNDLSWWSYLFVLFPLTILVGCFYNKSKTLLLTGFIFLITLFFVSANITNPGYEIYKAFFYIPGFKMFRNYYGQWSYVFIFYYALFFGQSLAIVLEKLSHRYRITLVFLAVVAIFGGSWPLLRGELVNSFHHQSKKVNIVFKMDPTFEDVIKFVSQMPTDAKIVSLPLTGPGYQIIGGVGNSAYIGPSIFSYLAAKNDYTGYGGLSPFGDVFLQAAKDKDYPLLGKLFSILNIKYVFYNSDSKIYDYNFPYYPYDYVKNYMPNNQAEYKDFIQNFPLKFDKKIDFGDKFHFYPVEDGIFLPHIYTVTDIIYANKPFTMQFNPEISTVATRAGFFDIEKSKNQSDSVIIEADSDTPLFLVNNNFHFHKHDPFISRSADEIFYPFVLLREKFDLWRQRSNHDTYVNYSLLYATKRIFELDTFGKEMKLGRENWQEPHLWEVYKWNEYNTWSGGIALYTQKMSELIDWINSHSISESYRYADKLKINEQLNQHKVRLDNSINSNSRNSEENSYLMSHINKMFDSLHAKLNLHKYNPDILTYKVTKPNLISGEYSVYVQDFKEGKDYNNTSLDVGNQKITPISSIPVNGLMQFQSVSVTNNNDIEVILRSPQVNLAKDFQWTSSGGGTHSDDSFVTLRLSNLTIDGSGGLTREIPGWKADKQFIISFDYRTFGNNFIFKLYDKRFNTDGSSKLSGLVYFERNLNSSSWKNAQAIIHSDINSLNGYLQIISNSQKKDSIIELKNLSIIQVRYPQIFFKRVSVPYVQSPRPKISFRKINPTKYEIHVTNSAASYMLVFSEAYSHHWKLFDASSPNSDRLNMVKYSAGRLGKLIVSLFIHDDTKNDQRVVGSYFNGEISEMKPRREFLIPSTFDSWGKKLVAYNSHMLANGYANAWYITPQDVNGKTSYTLILEMGNQRYLYVFLTISLVTVILLCIYFIAITIRKNEKNNN